MKFLAVAASIALLSAMSGCPRKAEGEFLVAMDSAAYYWCDGKCSSFSIKISLNNQTGHTYCVPVEYLSETLSEHMVFRDRDGRENQQVTPAGYPSISLVESESALRQYGLAPNYIVRSGQTRSIEVYTGDKFAVDARGGKIVAGIPAFRCDADKLSDSGYVVRTVTSNILPQRP